MPLYDIYCIKCKETHEVLCSIEEMVRGQMKCQNCGSYKVKRLFPLGNSYGYLQIKDLSNPQGSTAGIRARAREITKLEQEKLRDRYYNKK